MKRLPFSPCPTPLPIMSRILAIALFLQHGSALKITEDGDSLTVTGSYKYSPLEKWTGMKRSTNRTVKSLSLDNVHVNASELFEYVAQFPELYKLKLDIDFDGVFHSTKVKLNNLRTFRFVRFNWNLEESSSDEVMSMVFFDGGDLNFTRKAPEPWVRSNFDGLHIYVGGINSYFQYKAIGMTTLRDPHNLFQHFYFDRLHAQRSSLDVSKLPETVEILTLDEVTFENGTAGDLFAKCKSLRSLHYILKDREQLDLARFHFIEKLDLLDVKNAELISSIPLHLYLDALILQKASAQLENITFRQASSEGGMLKLTQTGMSSGDIGKILRNFVTMEVDLNEDGLEFDIATLRPSTNTALDIRLIGLNLTQSTSFQFKYLQVLKLSNCTFQPDFLQAFPNTFARVEDVHLEWRVDDSILAAVLSTSARHIFFFGYRFLQSPNVTAFVTAGGASVYNEKFGIFKTKNGLWEVDRPKGFRFISWIRDSVMISYVSLVLAVGIFGLFGNIVSGIVLSQKSMRNSTSVILLTLTLSDLAVVRGYLPSVQFFNIKLALKYIGFTHIYYTKFPDYLGQDWIHREILYPLIRTAYTASVYTTVLVTVERYVAVCCPLKAGLWTSVKRSVIGSVGVLSFALVLNAPRWAEANSSTYFIGTGKSLSTYVRDYMPPRVVRVPKVGSMLLTRWYMEYYQGWIWISFLYVIPLTVLAVLNCLILKQLRTSALQRRGMASAGPRSGEESYVREVTVSLFVITSIFGVCSVLNAAILIHFVVYRGEEPLDVECISSLPLIFNSSINFAIYTTIGKKFKAELKGLVRRLLPCLAPKAENPPLQLRVLRRATPRNLT